MFRTSLVHFHKERYQHVNMLVCLGFFQVLCQMEGFVIEIDKGNVQEVKTFVVTEQKFNESAELYLNDQVLLMEITNLLVDFKEDFNVHAMQRKTNIFTNLFHSALENKASKKDISRSTLSFTPTLDAIRVKTVALGEEGEDEDFDEDLYVVKQLQRSYMKQFLELSTSKTMSFPTVTNQMYSIMKSWRNPSSPKGALSHGEITCDAIIDKYLYRLNGDKASISSVQVLSPFATPNNETLTVSIYDYLNNLEQLQQGTVVTLYVNDFFDDFENEGVVLNTVQTKGLQIQLSGSLAPIFIPYRKYCPIYVFKKGNQGFNKTTFISTFNTKIICDPTLTFQENMKFVIPITGNECIFSHLDVIRKNNLNLPLIEQRILKPNGFTINDIDYVTLSKIKKIVSRAVFDISNVFVNKKIKEDKYEKSDIVKVLNTWIEYLHGKLTKLSKMNTSAAQSSLQKKQLDTDKKLEFALRNGIKCTSAKAGKIALRTNSYTQLMNSTDDQLYFQKEFDKTPYHIKHDIEKNNPHISNVEKKALLRQELQKMYPNLLDHEISFEIDSIVAGKRKVSVGDLAIVSIQELDKDLVFKRELVNGIPLWIRLHKYPFMTCTQEAVDRLSSKFDSTCILDNIKDVCENLEVAKLNFVSEILRQKEKCINEILEFSNEHALETHIMHLNNTIAAFIGSQFSVDRSKPLLRHYDVHDDVSEYFGDVEYIDVNAMYGNKEHFGDVYDVLNQNEDPQDDLLIESHELSTVKYLCKIYGIVLEDAHYKFIAGMGKEVTEKGMVMIQRDDIVAEITGKLNAATLKNPRVVLKVKEMAEKEFKRRKDDYYYKKLYTYLAAFLATIVMSQYPRIVLQQVYPGCTEYVSHSGYPLTKKGHRKSIQYYFACVLKKTIPVSDKNLHWFSKKETDVDQICGVIEDETDIILVSNPDVLKAIENNKGNHDFVVSKDNKLERTISQYERVFQGFKPIHEEIMFRSQNDAMILAEYKCIIENKNFTSLSENVKGSTFTPKQNHVHKHFDWFTQIDQENVIPVGSPQITKPKQELNLILECLGDTTTQIIDEQWWNYTLFSKIEFNYENIYATTLSLKFQHLWKYCKEHLLDNALLSIMRTFLRSRLPCELAQSIKKYNMENKPSLRDCLHEIIDVIICIKHYILQGTINNPEDVVKNNMLCIHIFFHLLNRLLEIDDLRYQTGYRDVVISIIGDITDTFMASLQNNSLNVDSVQKQMDELREKRKNDLMDKYKKNDDDERNLQITLRAIGVNNWYDVGETVDVVESYPDESGNTQFDEADLNMQEYLGEDPDYNEEDD